MRDACRDFECELAEFKRRGEPCSPAGEVPLKIALSRLVNSRKEVSSRRPRQEFPDLRRHYWRASRPLSGSYFAESVGGALITALRQYIEQQDRPA